MVGRGRPPAGLFGLGKVPIILRRNVFAVATTSGRSVLVFHSRPRGNETADADGAAKARDAMMTRAGSTP